MNELEVIALGFKIGSGLAKEETFYVGVPFDDYSSVTINRIYSTNQYYLNLGQCCFPIHDAEHLKKLLAFIQYQP